MTLTKKEENGMVILINIFSVISLLTLLLTIWPIYKWWSVVFVPVMGMGLLMMNHFVPFKDLKNSLLLLVYIFAIFGY